MEIPEEVKFVIEQLKKSGFEAYIVGGCVRDFLRNIEPEDWDIATNAKPEEIKKIFPKSFYENQFLTVTVQTGSKNPKLKEIEITTYRKEAKYTDKRHPDDIKFAKNIEEDLARRDFTINAMAATPEVSKFKIKNLKLKIILQEIKDSKKLSQKKRAKLYKLITRNQNIKWGIGRVSEKVIDKINIKNAAELAMEKALEKLKVKSSKLKVGFLIIDGTHIKNLKLKTYNFKLIPKADEKVFSCACASILAKVYRDKIMQKCHKKYPKYRFDLHKGYPTKLHLARLKRYGSCKIHRKSFKPVLILKFKTKNAKRKTTAKNLNLLK